MVKFGEELEIVEIPKYRGNYIQYNELKKAIEAFTGQDKHKANVTEVTHWSSSFLRLGPNPETSPEARFTRILSAELNRVSKFVTSEEASIKQQLEALQKDAPKGDEELCRRYAELGTEICNLKSFQQVNFSGFRKALKKFDKVSQKSTMQWFMSQVVKEPLMCIDFEGMLELYTDIGSILRKKGLMVYKDIAPSPSYQEEYQKGGLKERTFLVEAKAALSLRIKLAAFMAEKYPQERASKTARPQRPNKMKTTFLDTKDFKVYHDFMDYNNNLYQANESSRSCPSSLHIRSSERSQVVSAVYQAKGEGRKEVLLRSEDVPKLLRGEAPKAQPSSTPGARSVMANEPEANVEALQEVLRGFPTGLVPVAQATYCRSVLQDESGFMVSLDEDIRLGKVKELNEMMTASDYFDYMVVSIVFPAGKTLPRWLGFMEDGPIQANGFCKGAAAIARIAPGQKPHWYANVYSDAKGEAEQPLSVEPSEGSVKSHDDQEKTEIRDSPRLVANRRLLHELGTSPEQENQMAAARMAMARGLDGGFAEPAERGGLAEPLLAGKAPEPEPVGMMERLWGTEKDKPVRRAIVAVQPKTLYSNERTFLEWIHFATILAASGILMLHATDEVGHMVVGRLMVLAAIFLVVWSLHVFGWRADGLDYKVDMSYEDHVGPVALVGSILGALVLSTLHAVLG